MSKKPIFVTRSSMPPFEEYLEQIKPLWDSRVLSNDGALHKKLQAALSAYLDAAHLVLFVNGHNALELALGAMELSGEVITTPFTFASTTHAIVRNGLTPVFCDINPYDYTMDADQIERLITEKTSAIVPVHVYGNLCAVERIQSIADRYHLKVVYDAAHAFGVRKDGRSIARYGDAVMYSFHATKVFHTIEGGAVVCRDKDLQERLLACLNFGQCEQGVPYVGTNAKMNEFQAAMGLCNLRHLDREIAKRRAAAEMYRRLLSGVPGITLPPEERSVTSNYAYFPVLFDPCLFGMDRDAVCEALAEKKIFARKYFDPLTSSFDCYKGRFDTQKTPCAQEIASRVLTLPLYADLEPEAAEEIASVLLRLGRIKGK